MDKNEKTNIQQIYDLVENNNEENPNPATEEQTEEQTEAVNFFDVLMGLSVFMALGVGIISYFFPNLFGGAELFIIPLAIVTVLFALAGRGLITGQMWVRGGTITRKQSPIAFWGFFIFYIIAALLFSVAVLFL